MKATADNPTEVLLALDRELDHEVSVVNHQVRIMWHRPAPGASYIGNPSEGMKAITAPFLDGR